ncbi:CD2-associated protein [Papilio machaon]|uniref:CD2-associated protein n=1 Tax=Papilio machaon TaxID=76193 RepID=UPI001E663356|nr:CD2-associated protein [Papilio machaon]
MESTTSQKVTCVANYAYDASEPDELSIRPGDVVREVERLPGGWWRGELRGRRGMFPDNFVSVNNEHTTSRSVSAQGRCRAVFSYQPANPDELPLCVGDVLEVLGEVEEGWWQGRRQGRVGVFPSNFVVMLEPAQAQPAHPYEPAPALPPKPVKEQCRVLFPYTAVNEDELTLAEGEVVTILSKDAPDRGWWRGELHGRVGLFPDNFVQLLPPVTQEVDEKKPDRPPAKTTNAIYPVLNKYSEKTASVKELSTSKISLHKESTTSKESSTSSTSTVTHSSKLESEKIVHNDTVNDTPDGQVKKPPVPLKKSPTPSSGVSGLFSGLKNKMLSSSDKEKSSTISSGSSSSGEWDKIDGGVPSKATNATANATPTVNATPNATVVSNNIVTTNNVNTFDHVERNSILNDPRAGRVKAPRRRPPSQALRDDTPQQIGLSNGHEVPTEKSSGDKLEEIRPRAREWEKHRAPWMDELKMSQAKKTSFSDTKSRSVSTSSDTGVASKAGGGSTDRILECGLEERKTSTHSMEMSKSTSSISNRISVLENFEETKTRHSLESKKDANNSRDETNLNKTVPPLPSPTAAGRTLTAMLEELKKPSTPPMTAARSEPVTDRSPKYDKIVTSTEKISEINSITKSSAIIEKTSVIERPEKTEEKTERPTALSVGASTLERRSNSMKPDSKIEATDALIAQLNCRITNLEKLLEVQNAKFNAAIEELKYKLAVEMEKRQTLQSELEKLAQCVTQV